MAPENNDVEVLAPMHGPVGAEINMDVPSFFGTTLAECKKYINDYIQTFPRCQTEKRQSGLIEPLGETLSATGSSKVSKERLWHC
jgi:hypothetical protein